MTLPATILALETLERDSWITTGLATPHRSSWQSSLSVLDRPAQFKLTSNMQALTARCTPSHHLQGHSLLFLPRELQVKVAMRLSGPDLHALSGTCRGLRWLWLKASQEFQTLSNAPFHAIRGSEHAPATESQELSRDLAQKVRDFYTACGARLAIKLLWRSQVGVAPGRRPPRCGHSYQTFELPRRQPVL